MADADGRAFEPKLVAKLGHKDDTIVLTCPSVGRWRGVPPEGTLVSPGMSLGQLDILGILHRLVAPPGAFGVVTSAVKGRRIPIPVDFGDELCVLDPKAMTGAGLADADADAAAGGTGALVFRSPLSGRFYARESPDKPAFVSVGDVIEPGKTVALLEVMKTFNRIAYGGDELPAKARVKAILPNDEDDLEQGDPILELEPA